VGTIHRRARAGRGPAGTGDRTVAGGARAVPAAVPGPVAARRGLGGRHRPRRPPRRQPTARHCRGRRPRGARLGRAASRPRRPATGQPRPHRRGACRAGCRRRSGRGQVARHARPAPTRALAAGGVRPGAVGQGARRRPGGPGGSTL
ncbi:MAG: Transcriptional regulator, MarR family, partial [uncultured Acidimicrobiales bacterium]